RVRRRARGGGGGRRGARALVPLGGRTGEGPGTLRGRARPLSDPRGVRARPSRVLPGRGRGHRGGARAPAQGRDDDSGQRRDRRRSCDAGDRHHVRSAHARPELGGGRRRRALPETGLTVVRRRAQGADDPRRAEAGLVVRVLAESGALRRVPERGGGGVGAGARAVSDAGAVAGIGRAPHAPNNAPSLASPRYRWLRTAPSLCPVSAAISACDNPTSLCSTIAVRHVSGSWSSAASIRSTASRAISSALGVARLRY